MTRPCRSPHRLSSRECLSPDCQAPRFGLATARDSCSPLQDPFWRRRKYQNPLNCPTGSQSSSTSPSIPNARTRHTRASRATHRSWHPAAAHRRPSANTAPSGGSDQFPLRLPLEDRRRIKASLRLSPGTPDRRGRNLSSETGTGTTSRTSRTMTSSADSPSAISR